MLGMSKTILISIFENRFRFKVISRQNSEMAAWVTFPKKDRKIESTHIFLLLLGISNIQMLMFQQEEHKTI